MKASVKAAEDPNCAEPVCHSKVESLKAAFSRGETAIKRAMTGKVEPLKANLECPADREELGQNTWTLVCEECQSLLSCEVWFIIVCGTLATYYGGLLS